MDGLPPPGTPQAHKIAQIPTPPAQQPATPLQPGVDITDLLGQLFGQQGRERELPRRM